MEKGSRLPAPFRGFSGLLALYLSLGFLGGPGLVDVLGGGQDAVADVQLGAGEPRGHLQVGDVPVGQQIAPEGHLGGVVGLVFVVQIQLPQAAVGVAVGDDAHHLGVAGLFFG